MAKTIYKTDSYPYQVYTALFTQSGEEEIIRIDTGTLTVGVTYSIDKESLGMDFTNVGAPNNNVDTYFVATGTIPNSWGDEEGTDYNTLSYDIGAPVVTVLQNTIGHIWWGTNSALKLNYINSDNLFTQDKTFVTLIPTTNNNNTSLIQFIRASNRLAGNTVSPIEIRIYN
jgi:hypothetical protein